MTHKPGMIFRVFLADRIDIQYNIHPGDGFYLPDLIDRLLDL